MSTQFLPSSFQFAVFLVIGVVAVAATKVHEYAAPKYDTQEVEYAHYQPQQHQAVEEHQHHYHQAAATEEKHYKHIPIVKSESLREKDGSYKYHFEAANGIQQQEHGYVKNAGQKDHEIQVQEGYYSYTDEHGHQIGVHYIADENGFRATGDHLPTPPPLPEALREAYAKVAANPELYQEEHEEAEEPQQSYEHAAYHQAAAAAPHYRHAPAAGHQEYAHAPVSEDYKH